MSAYVVDPRTIDYLVQWAAFSSSAREVSISIAKPNELESYRYALSPAMRGFRLYPSRLEPSELGQILMDENVRSIQTRYPDTVAKPEDMPGPCDQTRVNKYVFRPVPHDLLRPAWVIRSCDCLDYQSCETDDWKETLASRLLEVIRASAVSAMVGEDAPWGVTDDDLKPKARVTQ